MFKVCCDWRIEENQAVLELMQACKITHEPQAEITLIIEHDRMGINYKNNEFFCDFHDAWHQNITYTINLNNCPLARALNLKPQSKILDATAGFGRDAFTLAVLQANITAIERHPLAALMLMYSARNMPNLNVVHNDHKQIIGQEPMDSIYFDFMFEKKHRRAKSNQGIELLVELVTSDPLPQAVWEAALATSKRVVIKRHRQQKQVPVIGIKPPNHTISTKTVCFDIYLGKLK